MKHVVLSRAWAGMAILLVGVGMRAEESAVIDLARPTGLAAIRMAEGFEIEMAAPKGMVHYPMCAALDDVGRLYVTESSGKDVSGKAMAEHPECRVSILEDTDADGVYDRSTVFAEGLSLPMGVLWHEGSVYIATPPDFVRLRDADGDGRADEREVLLTGWNVLNTASLHGPFLGPDGWLYLTHGRHGYKITTREGETLEGLAPRVWRCRPDGTGLERVCGGGFDNPVELVFTPMGEMLLTMTYFTDPQNGQRDALLHLVEGGVYPKNHECVKEFKRSGDFMPVMTKFARIAPAGFVQWRGNGWGAEFAENLYSAQFNPHRVQRHVLIREGATYRTEDSDFLVSSDPDFHPTDVLQDANSTMIVLDTGGWYVDACPLSKISKPDLTGGIYRVRRSGTQRPGQEQWAAGRSSASAMTGKDEIKSRIKSLARVAKNAKSSAERCDAVWSLMRIGTPAALGEVREALDNDNAEVRAAAAMALGRARDAKAARMLGKLARKDEPVVRRAAAEALGAIGGKRATEWLLDAAPRADDRFIEHAIIHGLIRLGDADALRRALETSKNPRIIQCALVALDQLDNSTLEMTRITPLLRHEDAALRQAALWMASRHADGAAAVASLIDERLGGAWTDPAELAPLREAALAFAASPPIQEAIAGWINRTDADEKRKLYLLDIIAGAGMGELPQSWTDALKAGLGDASEPVRARSISILRARNVRSADAELARIADDFKETPSLRMAALGAVQPLGGGISDDRFAFLAAQLKPNVAAPIRLAASQLIGSAKLTSGQLDVLVHEMLANVDSMALAPLLNALEGANDATMRDALMELTRSEAALRVLDSGRLDKLTAHLTPETRRLADPLRAGIAAEDEARVKKIREFEPLLSGGDVGRGRQVFFGKKAGCGGCHAIGTEGGRLGPDLTTIGQIRSGRDLLEAIIFPSATLVPGYEPFRVEVENDVLSGIIAEQDSATLLLRTGADAEIRLAKGQIRAILPASVSVMPEGLDAGLEKSEFLDLLAFLQAQNGEQWLQADPRREMRIPLFNGQDLEGFMTFEEGQGLVSEASRAAGEFSVVTLEDGGSVVHIAGKQRGYLGTKARARNYKLVAEFRIGKIRGDGALGLLIHAGTDDGERWPEALEVLAPTSDRDPWEGWRSLEVVCDDDVVRASLDGKPIFEREGVEPKSGRILIQSRGVEVFLRRLDLYPLY